MRAKINIFLDKANIFQDDDNYYLCNLCAKLGMRSVKTWHCFGKKMKSPTHARDETNKTNYGLR